MNQYYSLRFNELQTKAKLHKKIKETLTEINKMENILPKADIPKILKKEDEEKYHISKKQQEKKERYNRDIESELADIQRKLRMLQ